MPRRPRRSSRIDPELLRQLAQAEGRGTGAATGEVQAVLFLAPAPAGAAVDPGDVEATVTDLVRRVERSSRQRPGVVQVFANLASFVVQAPPAFVRELLAQPEIRNARANRPAGPET